MALVFRGNERDGTKTILILINQCVQLKKKITAACQTQRERKIEKEREEGREEGNIIINII